MQKTFTIQSPLFVHAADFDPPILHGLDDAEAVIDWSELERLMLSIYGLKTGRPSYPLLTLFRSLLLGIWYRLSDEQLAQCLLWDLLFHKFCRLELDGDVPDATALGRFRTKLMEHNLWELLLGEVNRQLGEKHIVIIKGQHHRRATLDRTGAIEAAQSGPGKNKDDRPTRDAEAGWHVKADSRGRTKATFGFSVHAGVDEDGFSHRQTVIAGNVHDSQDRDTLLLGDEAALYADTAYSSQATRERMERFGIEDRVQCKGYRGNPLSKNDKIRNAEIAVIRAGGGGNDRLLPTNNTTVSLEPVFWGWPKNLTFFATAAIAHNIQKAAKFFALYGIREPAFTG